MDEAKSRKLSEWIQEEANSKVRERQEVLEPRFMSMRWVLTWKPSQGRKAKARIGPEVAESKVARPSLSRLGKMLTLQRTAFNHAELECAGAKSASVQGDGHEMQDKEDACARALDEIACAMNIPLGGQ